MKIEQELKKLDVNNNSFLEQYIYFCKENNIGSKGKGIALHHILPSKVFPEYSDLISNKWNGSYLSFENHYIAHALLALAINNPSIIGAWWGMNNKDRNKGINGLDVIGPEKYSELLKKAQMEQSKRMKGKVQCRLKTDPEKSLIVEKVEYNKNRHLYLGNTEGKLSVINKETGDKIYINKENYNRDKHHFHKTGVKRNGESIQKEKRTKKKVGPDGLNISQRTGHKAAETLKKKLSEEEYKKLNMKKALVGKKNGNFGKVSMTNDNGRTSQRVLKENISKYLEKGYRLGGKKFTRKNDAYNKINKDFNLKENEKKMIKIMERVTNNKINLKLMRKSEKTFIEYIKYMYEPIRKRNRLVKLYINDDFKGFFTKKYFEKLKIKSIMNSSYNKRYLCNDIAFGQSKASEEVKNRFRNSYIEELTEKDYSEILRKISI